MILRRFALVGALAVFVQTSAVAQVPRGYTPVPADTQRMANESSAWKLQTAVESLQSKNYSVAEGTFQELLRKDPNDAELNLYMGVALMGQEKWTEAKKHLEVAVKRGPKNPDPKSRLGVTLIKLGERDGADAQRAELVKMAEACKAKCRNADFIANGIAMIDEAIAVATAATGSTQ